MNKSFQPVKESILDSWLQVRARPGLFAAIWLFFGFILPVGITLFSNLSQPESSLEEVGLAFDWPLLIAGLLLRGITSIYIVALLANIVKSFRNKINPVPGDVLREGLRYLPGLVLTAFFLLLRVAPAFLLMFIGIVGANLESMNIPETLAITAVILALFLFCRFFLFYGLSFFVYCSLEIVPAEALRRTKAYCIQNRNTVSWLFFLCMVLPIAIGFFLIPLVLGRATIMQIVVFFIFSNLLSFLSTIIYMNFSMNEIAD